MTFVLPRKLFCKYLEQTRVRFGSANTKSYKMTFVLQMQISTESMLSLVFVRAVFSRYHLLVYLVNKLNCIFFWTFLGFYS